MDELRTALELATQEELQELTEILFRPKFNPIDYVNRSEPIDIQSQDREQWLDAIERRFRFLAADGITVLRGRTSEVTYRQTLIQVCRYLKIPYSQQFSTTEIEAEVFLNLMGRTWKKLPPLEQKSLTLRIQRSIQQFQLCQPLPVHLQKDPIGLLLKGSSALALNSIIKPILLQQIARQFTLHFATYEVTKQAVIKSSIVVAGQVQNYVALETAKQGMAINAARYRTARRAFALIGPIMWGWFFADLGWRAIATNYGRIIPIIFALAQIRLTRTDCFEPA